MAFFPKASADSPPMFENEFLDKFTRTHPVVVPILFVPACSALLWYSVARLNISILTSGALFVVGFVAWSLAEYWLHRTLFHWVPPGKIGERMHFMIHGVHHDWPSDKYRLVMPPAVSISLFFIFGGIFSTLMGAYAWAFHAGFTAGYMSYDLTHYYLHHFKPKSAYANRLKRHHMLHHHREPHARYGVSFKLWDMVFGTRGSDVKTS